MAVPISNLFGCNGCKGAYSDTLPDGSIYMHACGPLPPDKNGVQAEAANKRDENIVIGRGDRILGIRSAGAGVTCLSNGKLTEPPWITAMNAAAAKQEAS